MLPIYAYGIIDFNGRIEKAIQGIEKSCVYNMPYHDIGVVVSDIQTGMRPAESYHVLEHEDVVEKLMDDFTVLPMRFRTVFNNKDNLMEMLTTYHSDFRQNLARLCNKAEFGIKVFWRGDIIRKRITDVYNKSHQVDYTSSGSSGKNFLIEKFRMHEIEKEFEKEANQYSEIIDNYFTPIAVEKKLKKLQTENLLLNASYLFDKDKQNIFVAAFEQLKKEHSGLKYLFSGPWPPYNFIQLFRAKPLGFGKEAHEKSN